jgi:gephyrin
MPGGCGESAGQWGWYAVTTGNQISSRLLSARSANALLELPAAEGILPGGTVVSALLIDDLCHMPVGAEPVPKTPGF